MEIVKELKSLDSSIKRYKDEINKYSKEFKRIYDNGKSVKVDYSLIELDTAFKSAVAFNHHFAFSIGNRYFIRNSNSFTIPIQEFREITKDEYDKVLDLSWRCISVETTLRNSTERFNELKKQLEYNELYELIADLDDHMSLSVYASGVSIDISLSRESYVPIFIPFKDTDEETKTTVKTVVDSWRNLSNYISWN